MTDATHHSLHQNLASPEALKPVPVSEDSRRPKAIVPYVCLWSATLLCVVFALIAMFLQR
jgi:hypothetical protein